MIHEVDSALRALIERDALGTRDVEIVFDAPTREWAGRRNAPTIDVYLYDIREDLRRRERGLLNEYDDDIRVIARHLPPRHFKLSYLVTAWTQRPEDEHRLLSSLLACFIRYDALPAELLSGPLAELERPVPITVALPPPEDRAFADVWSALGGELKPSIDLVVSTPVETGQRFETGPPVTDRPLVDLSGRTGWPPNERFGGHREVGVGASESGSDSSRARSETSAASTGSRGSGTASGESGSTAGAAGGGGKADSDQGATKPARTAGTKITMRRQRPRKSP